MKYTFLKKLLAFIIILTMIFACADETELDQNKNQNFRNSNELRISFARALSKSVSQSAELRAYLKNAALKKFDNDYDILYDLIKEDILENGFSIKQLLAKNFEDETYLEQIEREMPLLTIFIPSLPEESFSAELWNTDNQIPVIGIVNKNSNDVLIVGDERGDYILPSEFIPSYPILVIKDNERVALLKNDKDLKKTIKNIGSVITSNKGREYFFLSNTFDGVSPSYQDTSNLNARLSSPLELDQKVRDSYYIYLNSDGWQRDYIYYNITPTQTTGEFSYDFVEHIRDFSLQGVNNNAINTYNKIADQTGDPKLINNSTVNPIAGWTNGFYEFKVRVLLNARNGIGQEYITYFSAAPSELFQISYERRGSLYRPVISGLKVIDELNLPIFAWDISNYSTSVLVEIEEIDVSETTTITNTSQAEFATNFGIEGTVGTLKKIGLKFGASLKLVETQTIQRTYTQGNDPLGSVIINFGDKVVLNYNSSAGPAVRWQTRDYTTGWFTISFEPKQVQ